MTYFDPQNRLQKELRRRTFKVMKAIGMSVVALCLSMMFVHPTYAATIYSQTTHDGMVGGRIQASENVNTQDLGLISGTVDFIKVRAQNYLGASNTIEVALLCFDDGAYTSFNASCSWNQSGGRDGTVGRFVASSNSDVEFTVTPTTDFTLTAGKHYRLGYQCISGCTAGVTETAAVGEVATGDKYYILDGVAGATAELSFVTSGPYTVGQSITMNADWTNNINAYYLYFYEDAEETNPVRVVNNYPMGTTSDWTFSHAYSYDGTYAPFFVLGSSGCTTITATGAITGSGCTTYDSDVSSITVVSDQAYASDQEWLYQSEFTASKTSNVIVGETVNFTYDLSSNFCTGSTVSGKRLFKDLAGSQFSGNDAGTVLASGLTGTSSLIFDRTAQPYSDYFYPRIVVYCANATSHTVYLGGSVTINKAQGISVYQANDIRFALPEAWLGGGSSSTGGTTYSFQSDKRLYRPGEQVKLKYRFDGTQPFTVSTILLYDTNSGTLLKTLSGSEVTWSQNHYLSISYAYEGEYQPMLKLRNAGNTLYKNVFLGGTQTPTYNSVIAVTQQGSPLYVNTGAFLGQYGGTGGSVNMNGIFALSPRIGWGSTGNTYLDTVQGILSPVMWALWWIAQKLYSILEATVLFGFLFEMIHPMNGVCHTLPAVIFDFPVDSINIPMPAGLSGTQFCVSYTTSANAQYLTKMLYIIMGITVFFWVLDMIIPNRHEQ